MHTVEPGLLPCEARRRYLEAGRITRCRGTVFGEMEKASGGEAVDAAALE